MLIQQFVRANGIGELMHFTRTENLPSIIIRGLLTRNTINNRRTDEIFNDEQRLDRTDAVCVSIGFPNYKMFYRLRKNNETHEWAIISIHPSALWELRCAFCKTNAASSSVTSISLINRTTFSSLQDMYGDFEAVKRQALDIPNSWPTNPQAEVLFLDGIPRRYLMGFYTETTHLRDRLTRENPEIEFRFRPDVFAPRKDYKHWQNK